VNIIRFPLQQPTANEGELQALGLTKSGMSILLAVAQPLQSSDTFTGETIRRKVNMTKADLIEEVSRDVEMTRKEAEVIVEAIFDSVIRSLRGGDKIEIRGFGSFRTRQRQARVGCSGSA
jgi:Bacterial DNA-binding protein